MTLTGNWKLSDVAIRQLANDNTQVERAAFIHRGLPPSTIFDEAGNPVAVVHLHSNLVRAIFASVVTETVAPESSAVLAKEPESC